MSHHPTTESSQKSPQVFISYASDDVARAAALHAWLTAAGFEVWFDKARLAPGCDWHKEIEAGCEAARVILPLLTPRWQHSPWTKYETYASDAVIPVLADGKPEAVMPPPLRRWNAYALDPLMADDAAWGSLFSALRATLAEPVPERAPRILDLPYPANPFFTGRDDDLVSIHEELHQAPDAALTQGRVRALAAMGGVGKTTLANEYARRFWRLYPQILWVDARAGLESGFALLFEKLFPYRAGEDLKQPDKARLALAELSGKSERLLVIDNVEDAESVRPWLPRNATTGCRTLITSRFADWPLAAGIRSIALYVLEPGPAHQFLLARTGRTAEGAELAACDDLAKALDYLPLALEQAAAYMAAPGAGVGFAGYLRLYEAAAAELLARKALGSTEYPDAVITTWQATVAKLSPESCAVLRLCAWCADTPIPRALVMGGAKEVLALAAGYGPVMPLSGPAAAELRMRDALTGLARYSMIMDATDTTFRVHGLVQTVERVRAEQEQEKTSSLDGALASIEAALPSPEWDQKGGRLWEQLAPHCRNLLERLQDHEWSPKPRE
jgi:TIR domain